MSQLCYWIWLTTLSGLTPQSQLRLIEHFGSPEAVFRAAPEAFRRIEGVQKKELYALQFRDLRRAETVLENCRRMHISIITMEDAGYPQRLRHIDVPPLVLYYRGTLLPFDDLPVVAVVGSRKSSRYGQTEALRFGYELAGCGGTVVSGAARGVDSRALEGALRAGAQVAAVLGNGLDIVYPPENGKLYQAIMSHGCLISEYVPGTPPYGKNFPKRNRIMSGLSLGVVVVEAGKRSGSLITARLALEQGRDVFAVPGNLGEACCEGSNQLLQEGASLVTSGWDVLEIYQARFPSQLQPLDRQQRMPAPQDRQQLSPKQSTLELEMKNRQESREIPSNAEKRIDNAQKRNYIDLQQVKQNMTEDEQQLIDLLGNGKMHVDEIIDRSGLPAARVSSALTLLEVRGHVTRHSGNWFASNYT